VVFGTNQFGALLHSTEFLHFGVLHGTYSTCI
jgi:hypothetical protein